MIVQRQYWSADLESTTDGRTLRLHRPLEASDDTPAVVMIHGLETDWDLWLKLCPLLSDSFRPFCLELPWNGRNGHNWGHTRSASDWLRQGLALAPAPPVALVAHSLGANAVLEYLQANEIPGLQAVVLISPFYRSDYKEFDWNLFHGSQEIFWEIMAEGLRARQGQRQVDPWLLTAMADKVHEFVGPLGFLEFLCLFMRTPGLKLERMQVPVLVVGGVHDPGSTPAANADLVRTLPHGHLELLPECGHFSMLTHPEKLGEVLFHFLGECLGLSKELPATRARRRLNTRRSTGRGV
ncbi:MAG: alpha/beta hydrolase [Chloroflexi bacterium]|nr:alpha/beta hydrolase [Chloroflexota bacterium]